MPKSMNIKDKLNAAFLSNAPRMESVVTDSESVFDSKKELEEHISEGSLLNITTMASDNLAIPSGEYVVWATNSGTTVLVPTNLADVVNGLVPELQEKYDIYTSKLYIIHY